MAVFFLTLIWLTPFFVLSYLTTKRTLVLKNSDIISRLDLAINLVFSALAIRLVVKLINYNQLQAVNENLLFLSFIIFIAASLVRQKQRSALLLVKTVLILAIALVLTSWLLALASKVSLPHLKNNGQKPVAANKLPPGTRTQVVKKIVVRKKGMQVPPELVKVVRPKLKKVKPYRPSKGAPITEDPDVDLLHLLPRHLTDWQGIELRRLALNMIQLQLASTKINNLTVVVTIVGLHNANEAKTFYAQPLRVSTVHLANQLVFVEAYQGQVTVWWHKSRFAFEVQATGTNISYQDLRSSALTLAMQIIKDAPL